MKNIIFLLPLLINLYGCYGAPHPDAQNVILNDVHSRLNPTSVDQLFYPESTPDIVKIVKHAIRVNKAISISGGRHAMGGQQFAVGSIHISMKKMNDVIRLDKAKGIVRVEAGIEWPKLIDTLLEKQEGDWPQWGIAQKQSGANNLTLGGALSANAHSRAVKFKPIIQDVESFTLVNAEGKVLNVSRSENEELFRLVIGGYGLFGVIAHVDLRLQKRTKLERVVEVITIADLPRKAREKLESGYLYGDFQYNTDSTSEDFMRQGVFSAYKPLPDDAPMPEVKQKLDSKKWNQLVLLAHTDKSKAFDMFSQYYLSTNGNHYWSDTHQMSYYNENYIDLVDEVVTPKGSLMLSESYVPRDKITTFIENIIEDAKEFSYDIVYGTLRLIEEDDESYLAWAKQNYACTIINLRVDHTEEGIRKAKLDFQRIIDRALELDGSYFLTYHRWARPDQILKAYPQFIDFLKKKRQYDPNGRFQSEWYRHYKRMFANQNL